ncbi:MAG: uracil-DNA glycosylase family protein [Eubacteriaceae bacterium]|nr:uracil-DNA glycosylase family protein [Eubacteriaceae bacterium]
MNNTDFDTLISSILSCRHCAETFGFTPSPVVWGNKDAKIMHISQAPSKTVSQSLQPFTDKSGQKLKYQWYDITDEIFYDKDNFYITSVSHCYPGKNKHGGDRLPPKLCFDRWVKKEIETVNCELYIIVGSHAAGRIFPKKDFGELVFTDMTLNDRKCLILPHPSPLNRRWLAENPEFEEKRLPYIRNIIHDILNISKE